MKNVKKEVFNVKYCGKCGAQLFDEAVVCPNCGCFQKNPASSAQQDSSNIGWAVLGFFFPLVGFILYLIWKDETPLKAKSVGKGALLSLILPFVLFIIIFIFSFIFTLIVNLTSIPYYYY